MRSVAASSSTASPLHQYRPISPFYPPTNQQISTGTITAAAAEIVNANTLHTKKVQIILRKRWRTLQHQIRYHSYWTTPIFSPRANPSASESSPKYNPVQSSKPRVSGSFHDFRIRTLSYFYQQINGLINVNEIDTVHTSIKSIQRSK